MLPMPPISASRSRSRLACLPVALLVGLSACSSSSPGADGGAAPASSASGTGAPGSGAPGSGVHSTSDVLVGACGPVGTTRKCCGTATQTCATDDLGEFSTWGPCIDTGGEELDCDTTPPACSDGDVGPGCVTQPPSDAGSSCADSEFGCGTTEDGGPPPPPPDSCDDPEINNEPEILAAYSPADGESVSQCEDVKVWVNDEWAAFIAPGEQVDPATGMVTSPGNRSTRAPDGFLYEPALYIGNAPPIFPTHIKGWYNNAPQDFVKGKGGPKMANAPGIEGAPIDPAPAGTDLHEEYTTEFVWNLCSLGLAPGTYEAKFVVADGDRDRAIGCVTIVVTP